MRAKGAKEQMSTNYPAPKGIEPVISLSTRVSPEVMGLLDNAVAQMGCTQRAAVEYAIRVAYSPSAEPEVDPREDWNRRREEASDAYKAALQAFFTLTEGGRGMPLAEFERQLVAANAECDRTGRALLAIETEEEQWQ